MKYIFILLFIPKLVFSGMSDFINTTEKKYNLPKGILRAIIKVESSGRNIINHNDGNRAQKARGLRVKSLGPMQVQLAAARSVGFRGKVGELMDPTVNIDVGARYLKKYLDLYHDVARALTCYNSGPRRCSRGRYTPYVGKVLNAWVVE